jgi:hypothetical protein
VHVGLGQSAVFVTIAIVVDRGHAGPILAGGALAAGFMYASYWHARRAGLGSCEPGTEGQSDTPWSLPKASQ